MLGFLLGSLFVGSALQEQQNTKAELEKTKAELEKLKKQVGDEDA